MARTLFPTQVLLCSLNTSARIRQCDALRHIRSRWREGQAAASAIIIARDEIKSIQHLLARLLAGEHFDVIHVDQVSMAQHGWRGWSLHYLLDLHWMLHA